MLKKIEYSSLDRFQYINKMSIIYVLACACNKYYVGKTDRPLGKRVLEHFVQRGSEWTSMYQPHRVIESITSTDPLKEDEITKKYMMKYGIENVRGGSYAMPNLPDYKLQALEDEFCTAENLCFSCMQPGHFANQCPVKKHKVEKNVCFRCMRSGHYASQCYAKTTVDGELIGDSDDSDEDYETDSDYDSEY